MEQLIIPSWGAHRGQMHPKQIRQALLGEVREQITLRVGEVGEVFAEFGHASRWSGSIRGCCGLARKLLCSCFKKGLNYAFEKALVIGKKAWQLCHDSVGLGIGHGVVAEWLHRRGLATSAGAAAHL